MRIRGDSGVRSGAVMTQGAEGVGCQGPKTDDLIRIIVSIDSTRMRVSFVAVVCYGYGYGYREGS